MKKLFTSFSIGKLNLDSRIIMAAMVGNLSTVDGMVTDRLIDFHVNIAKGGCPLNMTEASYISQQGKRIKYGLGIYDDKLIPGLKRLTRAVHDAGGKIAMQLCHGGRECSSEITGEKPVGPSTLKSGFRAITRQSEIPRELTVSEIQYIITQFGDAAKRVQESGFDAVELHGAHGYLISQFLSPYSNVRTDEYGGDQIKRCRFLRELLSEVRKRVGPDFPIIVKLNIHDYVDGGITPELAKITVREAEKSGADAIVASAALHESRPYVQVSPMSIPPFTNVEIASIVKKEVSIPVGVVGRITEPQRANSIIEENKVDFVVLGRPLLADPEWPNKAREGRYEDIAECLACNQGCIDMTHKLESFTCLRNPTIGREREFEIKKASEVKNVVVIGGGPAGMEAARIAAIRKHRVTLYEKAATLGGQINLAKLPPHRENLEMLTNYLSKQLLKLGVNVVMNKNATPQFIENLDADIIIMATGALPCNPPIKGIKRKNVVKSWDLLSGKAKAGKNIVVIGAGLLGLEMADFLLKKKSRIVILEMLETISTDLGNANRIYFEDNVLSNPDVEVVVGAKVVSIDSSGLVYMHNKWKKKIYDVDTIVLATGAICNDNLTNKLSAKTKKKVIQIGDCVKPKNIMEAVYQGGKVARII